MRDIEILAERSVVQRWVRTYGKAPYFYPRAWAARQDVQRWMDTIGGPVAAARVWFADFPDRPSNDEADAPKLGDV